MRLIVLPLLLALLSFAPLPLLAQPPAGPPATASFSFLTGREPLVSLTGQWRFHPGDDARWALPTFDDSSWPLLHSDQPWSTQGYNGLSGFAWYRFTVQTPSPAVPLALLLPSILTDYEVFDNGQKIGGFGRMPPHGSLSFNQTLLYHLPPAPAGATIHLALRVWHHPTFAAYLGGGPRYGGAVVGSDTLLTDQFRLVEADRSTHAVDLFTIGILDAVIGFTVFGLFLFRRSEREYLWFAVLLLSGAAAAALYISDFLLHYSLGWRDVLSELLGSIGLAASLFFFSRVLDEKPSLVSRGVLLLALLDPLNVVLYVLRWTSAATSSTLRVLFDLPIELWIVALLLRRTAAGSRNARLLVIPTVLLYGSQIVYGLLLTSFQFGWRRNVVSSISQWDVVQTPFPIHPGSLVQLIFVVALLAFLIRRFARSRASEQRHTADLEAARTLQHMLIPETLPALAGLAIQTAYHPAQEVGGDFFQILPQSSGDTLILLGDVAGKGLAAAMTVSLLVGAVRALSETTASPGALLAGLNRRLLGRGSGFTTALALRLGASGTLTLASAGHLAPYCNGCELPLPPALPLGVDPAATYPEQTLQLQPGDRLTLLTDGVPEATCRRELFGFDRTQQLSVHPAHDIADAARAFGQTDDITVLTVDLQPSSPVPATL